MTPRFGEEARGSAPQAWPAAKTPRFDDLKIFPATQLADEQAPRVGSTKSGPPVRGSVEAKRGAAFSGGTEV